MKLLTTLFAFLTVFFASAQDTVQVNLNTQRYLDTVSKLKRNVYFNVHATPRDKDMSKFLNDYNVGTGRGFWSAFTYAKQKTKTVGEYPSSQNENKSIKNTVRLIQTEHPKNVFKDGIDPIKAGQWAANYFKNHHKGLLPEFFEPMNEPFVHAKDFYEGKWNTERVNSIKKQMAVLYGECGKAIHNTPELKNMKVIGYSSAWPSMELKDFNHWETGMKMFMDTAGEHMDAFATHLYDGINVKGQKNIRSGSNAEAILDLIENYSFIKWGNIKPHAISEYGAIEKGYGPKYSDVKSVQTVRSINHLLFELLNREDRMLISVPFITGKAKWHINEANDYLPYVAVLFRPTKVKKTDNPNRPIIKGWKYTIRVKFYELWKDVKGYRVQHFSSNPDIQSQAFVDQNKLFLALSNLDEKSHQVNLNFTQLNANKLLNIKSKSLKIFDKKNPIYKEKSFGNKAIKQLTLLPHETVILEYTHEKEIQFTKKSKVSTHYSKTYLQTIKEKEALSFTFDNVNTEGTGNAVIKLGIGRAHSLSKKPEVKVNGQKVNVPDNWKGYDQKSRKLFFGVIDIPFNIKLLKNGENKVTITFPDTGGRVSSLVLQTELMP